MGSNVPDAENFEEALSFAAYAFVEKGKIHSNIEGGL